MITKDGLIRIKWAGGNTPYFEIQSTGDRVYPSKRELLSIRDAINMFEEAYPESFTEGTIDNQDEDWESDVELNVKELMKEQQINKKRWEALDKIARDAGFDDDAFAYTEFSLKPFFEAIVEECAKQAELQARTYSGENNESAGCHSAAAAIRNFGKTLGITE